jgi:LemA protein
MKRITFFSTISLIATICFVIIIISGDDCDECFSAPAMAVKFLICGLVIIVASIYFKEKYIKTESIIFDIESEPLRGTDEAVGEVPFAGKGIIESEDGKLLHSPYTNTPCVYFHSIKEEYVRRGKNSSWVIVENIATFVPFHIKDEKGILKIDLADIDYDFSQYKIPLFHENTLYPKNSEIDCEALLKRNIYTEVREGFLGLINSRRYRRSEFVLCPGTMVFACGFVSDKNGQLMLHENEKYPLIITQKSREQYIEEFYQGDNLIYFSHILEAFGYNVLIFSLNYFFKFYPSFLLSLLLIGNLVILGSIIFSLYNRVITLKQRALGALSNIEIDLKRRADLIPNLVEVVKGYSKYEKEVQQIITESRSEMVFSKEMPKEKAPIINSLVATIENYPSLRASEQFQSLANTLVDTEGRIAHSREFYNRSVRKYNTLISQFPFLLVSFPLGMKEMDFVSIDRGESAVRIAAF